MTLLNCACRCHHGCHCRNEDFGTSPIFEPLPNKPLLACVRQGGATEVEKQWRFENLCFAASLASIDALNKDDLTRHERDRCQEVAATASESQCAPMAVRELNAEGIEG